MKNYKYLFVFFILASLLTSCQLTNVTDIVPPYQLDEASAITNIPSAEKVLNAAYSRVRSYDLITTQPACTGCMGFSFVRGNDGSANHEQFYNNSVTPDNTLLEGVYTTWYYIINLSGHIIDKTGKLSTDATRKNQIIGEAAFLRAIAHFYLLRWYGQFFDVNSPYGIVTWNRPVTDVTPRPRNTVKETYDQIFSDLELAIINAPEYSVATYASKQAALALKAKVLLYQRNYSAAATTAALAIAQKGAVTIEPVFGSVFAKWFNSKEVLFASFFDTKTETNNKAYSFRAMVLPTPYYLNFMTGDSRKDVTVYQGPTTLRTGKFEYPPTGGTSGTEYYLRLPELYLIQAEALVRSSNGTANFQAARDAVNIVRGRVNMPLIDNTVNTKEALLAAIRKEKQLELGCESGEEWYDLVRFSIEGDLKMTDYKPKAVNSTRYIVPIPFSTVLTSANLIKQNPGYE